MAMMATTCNFVVLVRICFCVYMSDSSEMELGLYRVEEGGANVVVAVGNGVFQLTLAS